MSPLMNKPEVETICKFIDQLVSISGYPDGAKDIRLKIDILERTLELLRIANKCLTNSLSFEEYIQGNVFIENNSLHYHQPRRKIDLGSGTASIHLQPKLLLFLLFYHRHSYKIYNIIENFIRTIWDQLDLLDFEKTKTGVTRCFTNTRFAANTLRDYGLLKFTEKEAYKTWVLSLPGFVVASKVLQDGDWKLRKVGKEFNTDLHPDIFKAWVGLQTYDGFVERLTSICEPNTPLFHTFDGILRKAHSLLEGYWAAIQDPSLSAIERKKESTKRLEQLEQDPRIEKFYEEFSKYLKLEELLENFKSGGVS